ncbi:MAG: hypothetical protein S0880_21520 [Actinomycetota bacterium]|nr:hypothetical protein [Actinomycetota bacterium]
MPAADSIGRRWSGVVALGVLTITSYGSWFYGFGVLIDAISAAEGWGTTALGLTYGAAQVITGVGSFVGGRLLDRRGGAGPFGVQATVGGGCLLAATWAGDVVVFGILYGAGAGVIGATGFYSVTTAAAARLRPDRPDRAIAVLTVIGAFASPIYLPVTAWLVSVSDWRTAARVLALAAIVGAGVAAIVVGRGGAGSGAGWSARPLDAMRSALARPPVRRMLAVYGAAGAAYSSVLVYQVPILTGAGVGLAAAGFVGGLRGFCQIFGRISLASAIERVGAARLLRFAYAASAVGVGFLLIGSVPAGVAYGVIGGVALGATSPLQAIYARSQFGTADLGLLMGLQGAALGIAGGVGPLVGGAAHDVTGSWVPVVVLAMAALAVATALAGRDARHPTAGASRPGEG